MEGAAFKDEGQRTKDEQKRFVLRPLAFVLIVCACSGGCRQRCQFVEMALRSRESELRETREKLHQSQMLNEALVQELQALKQPAPATVSAGKNPGGTILKEIAVGRQSGGVDDDSTPGDEALQVVVEPHDLNGKVVKATGSVQISAAEIDAKGVQTPLSSWQMPYDQLRLTWRSGLLSTGYFIVFPWKTWPTTNKLHVIARFTLAEGSSFEASRDVTIRLTKNPPRRPIAPPELDIPLPAPRQFEGEGPEVRNKPTEQPIAPTANWQPPSVILLLPEPVEAEHKNN